MFQTKPAVVSLMLMATSFIHAQYTDAINSNRPGESMSPFSVGKTVIQAEAGLTYINEDHDLLGYKSSGFALDTDVRYGAFFEQLELILNMQYRFDKYEAPAGNDKRNGFNQFVIGGKYLVYDPDKNYEKKPNLYSWKANHKFSWHDFIPSVAVYGGLNLYFFDNPFFDKDESVTPKAMVLTQNEFGRYVFVTNFFIDDLMSSRYQSYGYVLTLTRGFNDQWSGFIENQGFKGDYYSDGIFRIGAAYLLKENMQIDASVGKNIKDTPSIFTAGIGFSWRFDDNYEEVLIRAPKDKDEKKSKEEKKKEKEAKKRKDAIEGTETK